MYLSHGKIGFALGLEWTPVDGTTPHHRLREILGKGVDAYFQVLGNRRTGQRVGYTTTMPGPEIARGTRIYSLAAMLEAGGRDGVYFLEAGDHAWYCVISEGRLAEAGERLTGTPQAVAAVSAIAETLDLQVYGGSIYFPQARPFDLGEAVRAVRKPQPMTSLNASAAGKAKAAFVLLSVLAVIGYGGWKFVLAPPPAPSAETLAEMAAQAYVNSTLHALPTLAADPMWIVNAHTSADTAFPDVVAGWELRSLTCTAERCGAVYGVSSEHSYRSLGALRTRFTGYPVQFKAAEREALVTVPQAVEARRWDASFIKAPPSAKEDVFDVVGALPTILPQVGVNPTPRREPVGKGTRPVGVPGIVREAVITSGTDLYPKATFAELASVMAEFGFIPDLIEREIAQGRTQARWTVTWVRYVREEA
jgi:hypothetical protein